MWRSWTTTRTLSAPCSTWASSQPRPAPASSAPLRARRTEALTFRTRRSGSLATTATGRSTRPTCTRSASSGSTWPSTCDTSLKRMPQSTRPTSRRSLTTRLSRTTWRSSTRRCTRQSGRTPLSSPRPCSRATKASSNALRRRRSRSARPPSRPSVPLSRQPMRRTTKMMTRKTTSRLYEPPFAFGLQWLFDEAHATTCLCVAPYFRNQHPKKR
mmetsp:Transcript_27678/g.61777  ORF Transcript_27678/g.61777 Transcript_27678/m.61777 type:complete len:214 (-) Transcript_27678:12-653(-)